jgi:hypothetical protein
MVKNDVVKLAHFQSVYENTDAGQPAQETSESLQADDEGDSGTFVDVLPTGLAGLGLGAIATVVGFGIPVAGLFWWRRQ